MRHRVESPKANAQRKRVRQRDAQRKALINRVLQRHYAMQPPTPSALAITEMKMPGARVLEGYGSVFNLPDYQGDIVAPGAFDDWLASYDQSHPLPLLLGHKLNDPGAVMGWAQSISVDEHGLWARFALLPEHGEQVLRKVRSGELDGLSIGFVTEDDRAPTWPERELGARRVLTRIHLREISLVREPANTASRAYSVKSRAQQLVADVREALAAQRQAQEAMTQVEMHELRNRINRVLAYAR